MIKNSGKIAENREKIYFFTFQNEQEARTVEPGVREAESGTRTRAPTPINSDRLAPFLRRYPNTQDAQFLREGFQQGFHIGYKGQRMTIMAKT